MRRYPSRYASSSFSFGPGPLPPALKALIWANVIMFLVTWPRAAAPLVRLLELAPADVFGRFWVWQPVTYLFLHGSVFHILFNMLMLWMFGTELEYMWGSRFFLKYYFVTGIGAAATMLLLSLFSSSVYYAATIGASGAIYGVLLAYALYFPNRPVFLYFVFPIPVKYFVLILGAISFLSVTDSTSGVAHGAHLGGLVVGYLYLKGLRGLRLGRFQVSPIAELKYRYLKWKFDRQRRKFDVYSGGRSDRHLH
jgi:membrane associated rhomboid family serine protease